ncbi:Protein kinase [Maudiozyma exigua]|uniref:non-specific serine/threonine protein kinase n=1 Tax=Maudiozyma exigua TaxID=34358 RepID=A0A9P6WCD5_MAUEX|nr:Protein kinase [Kazachstania exigua]
MNKIKALFHKNKKIDTEQKIETITSNVPDTRIVEPEIVPLQISAELETQDIPPTSENIMIPSQSDLKQPIQNSPTSLHSSMDNDDDDSNLSLLSSDFASEYSYGLSQDESEINNLSEDNLFSEQLELSDYKLIEKIGEGAFSKVYRGKPLENSIVAQNYKNVAIKIIKKDILTLEDNELVEINGEKHKSSNRTSTREQVLKEVALHKQVSPGCKNIVQFIDFKESSSYYYIIQELLNGGEIFNEIVKLTYLSEDLTRHIGKQLGHAIKHLHSMGVVHRDIKPENLLFNPIDFIPSPQRKFRKSDDPNTKMDEGVFRPGIGGGRIGTVKLADFGLSKQIFQTNTKTPCGTVGYTASEVVKDEKYSMKVDMWGIGCVIYTMLCGFPPFYDDKINILTEKISRGEYTFLQPWWDEISDGAKNCVSKLLEVDPLKRYDIDEFLNDPWLTTYDCVPSNKDKDTSSSSKKRKTKQHRRRVLFNQFMDNDVLYSPAAVAMRDAFDISNAVARIEEEKMLTPVYGLSSLAEDETASFDEEQIKEEKRQQDRQQELENKMFHLKLDSSTIVKRRKQKLNSIP